MQALSHLKILVNLALIDGKLTDNERQYIVNIGKANGVNEKECVSLLEGKHEITMPAGLNSDQKFDYVFSLVQLMKIDNRLFKEEIKYCSQVASRLGYKQDVMFELMLKVSAIMEESEIHTLRQLIDSYLIK